MNSRQWLIEIEYILTVLLVRQRSMFDLLLPRAKLSHLLCSIVFGGIVSLRTQEMCRRPGHPSRLISLLERRLMAHFSSVFWIVRPTRYHRLGSTIALSLSSPRRWRQLVQATRPLSPAPTVQRVRRRLLTSLGSLFGRPHMVACLLSPQITTSIVRGPSLCVGFRARTCVQACSNCMGVLR